MFVPPEYEAYVPKMATADIIHYPFQTTELASYVKAIVSGLQPEDYFKGPECAAEFYGALDGVSWLYHNMTSLK